MATVYIPTLLRDVMGGESQVVVEGGTLRRVIESLDQKFPGIAARLRDGDSIAPGLAVDVDGVFANQGLLTPVGPDSEIHFLPAIGGGVRKDEG